MRRACAVTSGPIPSPPRMTRRPRVFVMESLSPRQIVDPRPALPVARLEVRDLAVALQRLADLVEPGEERRPPAGIDREGDALARRRLYDGGVEIDGKRRPRRCLDELGEPLHRRRLEHDRQQPVLEAIVEEDVAEARRDD